jgi:peptide/nickel transport system permease protein
VSVARYIVHRVLLFIPVVLGVTIVVFVLERVLPGDIVHLMQGEGGANANLQPDQIAAFKHTLGLDKPIPVQYLIWLKGFVTGNLGTSVWTREPVLGEIARRLPVTVELTLLAVMISLIIALPVAVLSAVRQDSALDYGARILSIAGLAVPGFWLGAIIITIESSWFQYLPPPGYDSLFTSPWNNLQQVFWPSFVLAVGFAATVMRLLRSTLLEVLREDYVRTARAKGLRERAIVLRHATRNAILPVLTLIGNYTGYLLGGTVIIETVFSLPGLGRLTVDSILQKDFPQVQANIVVLALGFVLVNFLVDISYGIIDPRIRYG